MPYQPFDLGQVVTNDELREAFRVGNMGGMRKSNTYGCLVLISDHTKGLYEDKWYGDELHYTGMGKTGDQVLEGNQNGIVYHSVTNGVILHLFEVPQPREYTYRGIVTLSGKPYQEEQRDENGDLRKVWMFPLKAGNGAPILSEEEFRAVEKVKQQQAEQMSMPALRKAAVANSTTKPGTRTVNSTTVVRNPYVSEYAKRLANGVCALCNQPAPFKDTSSKPYLETHHIIWLSEGGADSIANTVALCPNCHRRMHVLKRQEDVTKLKRIAERNAQA